MDNLRVFLWVGFALLVFMTVQTWQQDYRRPVPAADLESPAQAPADVIPTVPELPDDEKPLPALPDAAVAAQTPDEAPAISSNLVTVRTDVFTARIDLAGGNLVYAALNEYPLRKDDPDTPVVLLNPDPDEYHVLRTGVRAADGLPEPNHKAVFTAPQTEYVLGDDDEAVSVVLSWAEGDVSATKTYRFTRGRYNVDVETAVTNGTQEPYRAVSYVQLHRRHAPPERSMFNVDSYSFVGPVFYDGEKYEKLDPEDLAEEPEEHSLPGGWVASIQHHFLSAAVPEADRVENYTLTADDTAYILSAVDGSFTTIAPAATATFADQLFVGPKLQEQLKETAPGLALTVDYGVLTLLAQPLFWLLQQAYNFVGNWGWAIILVTFLIKLVFYKLTEASGRSMAKMRKLQPRLKALQEQYKDDRETMSRKLMEMYKREKVNPAAGCLPMLIQIPFFIAFYWVLLESVEMRQAPFMLWIEDLSARDPFFILPLLMGGAMYLQQKLNPAPPDPVQAKVMQFLPVMFTVFFAFFPSGLVLYWLTNSVLSIAQQWRINKVLGAD